MVIALLENRFKLTIHHIAIEEAGIALVKRQPSAKSGSLKGR
jgi:hypothetical protein